MKPRARAGSSRNLVRKAQDAAEAARVNQQLAPRASSPKESTPKAGTPPNTQIARGADSKYGVKPDHMVGESALAQTRLTRPRSHGQDQELVSDSDEPLQKAVQVLRESLKKN